MSKELAFVARPARVCRKHLRVGRQPAPALADPGVERQIYVSEPATRYSHLQSLRSDADRFIWHHHVCPPRDVNQKMPTAITGKAGDDAICLLESKPGSEGRVTRFTLPTDGLDRASTNGSFHACLVEIASTRLYRERTLTRAGARQHEQGPSGPNDPRHCAASAGGAFSARPGDTPACPSRITMLPTITLLGTIISFFSASRRTVKPRETSSTVAVTNPLGELS